MPLLNLPSSSCSEMKTQYSTFCLCINGCMWFIKFVNCCALFLYGIMKATFCLDLQDFGRKQPSATQLPAFFHASANGISSRSNSWKPMRLGPPRSQRGRLSLGVFKTQFGGSEYEESSGRGDFARVELWAFGNKVRSGGADICCSERFSFEFSEFSGSVVSEFSSGIPKLF